MTETETADATPAEAANACPHCGKPVALCVCDGIEPFDNQIELVILQHPQEQDRTLGTARLTIRHFKNSMFKIGLSWPSLAKILDRPVDPQRWAILYLGSVKAAEIAPGHDIVVVNRKGEAERDQDEALRFLEGVIVLDGTWSQAKALWWRNPWMLRCRRIVLNPSRPSGYGKLRREPRRDGLATIEAAAMLLGRLEHNPKIETVLNANFEKMLAKYRASGESAAGQKPRRDFRRRRPPRKK